jgi:hypothetical protein
MNVLGTLSEAVCANSSAWAATNTLNGFDCSTLLTTYSGSSISESTLTYDQCQTTVSGSALSALVLTLSDGCCEGHETGDRKTYLCLPPSIERVCGTIASYDVTKSFGGEVTCGAAAHSLFTSDYPGSDNLTSLNATVCAQTSGIQANSVYVTVETAIENMRANCCTSNTGTDCVTAEAEASDAPNPLFSALWSLTMVGVLAGIM